jgi:hypothetical protein
MNVYLDDQRDPYEGWVLARRVDEAIELLKTGKVATISLDYYLSEDVNDPTGWDVLTWIEEQVISRGFKPPKIRLHTTSLEGRMIMGAVVERIVEAHEANIRKGNAGKMRS